MSNFIFQVLVQGAIIALIWFLVSRDATSLRERHGTAPAGISPFAWGALCGLTWVALIPYLVIRRRSAGGDVPTQERNLLTWWVVLAVASAVWAFTNYRDDDANNGTQHALLAGTFAVCALLAAARDRKPEATHA